MFRKPLSSGSSFPKPSPARRRVALRGRPLLPLELTAATWAAEGWLREGAVSKWMLKNACNALVPR
ncbi:hypothetical protein K402DRAFT_168103 [Aulographum hederae CBS 113979]|uniref:Uncharacterized protein n=1 Tax=Aulographum hederae CBS 113979 TaxID=1176131 RepID=A0A6G1HCT5_9PEZI|nr:hypothetical protein K402DRAFT_168103 [Aulographum hederae CBS 113979]